ncbi:MAG: PQQ-binding-like beta-propeller repeat protein [Bacteroidota bacterium]|nr:PQQ-binding-like beta-propeller repeat protein [Bacteroidota bacterium]
MPLMIKLSLTIFSILPVLISLYDNLVNEEKIAWTFQTSGPVVASPVIFDGLLYIGSMDSSFYALDAKTGKEHWQFKSGSQISSTAAIYNGLCYFESGNILYALNRKGKLRWKFTLYSGEENHKLDPWDFQHSSPVIHDGVLYIGTEQGILIGVDAKTGEAVFRCQTISESAIRATPVVSDGLVMYGDWDGVFYANRIENGTLAWKYDTKKDGTFPWVNAIHGSPIVNNGQVYFAGRSCRLYSLDARTGKKNWHYSSPTDQWLLGGPQIVDSSVFLGSSDQKLFHAFDARNGELLWAAEVDGRTWGKACVREDRVFIGSNSFYSLDRETGEIREQYRFPQVHADKKYGEYTDQTANFHSSPTSFNGMIILGSDDGHIYALKML